MAKSSNDKSRDETVRIIDNSTERTSRACSLLFQSWMNLGSQILVGSAKSVATTLEDLNDLYCDPRGGQDRSRNQERCESDRLD